MRFLIVYFSFSENNRLLAQYLAERLKCDLCPIVETKRRSALTILLDMFFKRDPKIQPIECSISNYNRTILVAPIWDGRLANPMRSLIQQEKDALSNYSFISLCGYERAEQKANITQELSDLTGHPPTAVSELRICELFPVEKRNDIKTISGYHAKREDLNIFGSQIDEFLELIQQGE